MVFVLIRLCDFTGGGEVLSVIGALGFVLSDCRFLFGLTQIDFAEFQSCVGKRESRQTNLNKKLRRNLFKHVFGARKRCRLAQTTES
jgi:hypothetical protein